MNSEIEIVIGIALAVLIVMAAYGAVKAGSNETGGTITTWIDGLGSSENSDYSFKNPKTDTDSSFETRDEPQRSVWV